MPLSFLKENAYSNRWATHFFHHWFQPFFIFYLIVMDEVGKNEAHEKIVIYAYNK